VIFARGIDVQIVAIDGTWNRKCAMMDVSETGARLALMAPFGGLNLKEFFCCYHQREPHSGDANWPGLTVKKLVPIS
jgi:hypothetical protein